MSEANNKARDKPTEEAKPDYWMLEETYPEIGSLLSSSKIGKASEGSTIIVLDTNVLLVPFKVGGKEFSAIERIYKLLIDQDRLFVPARVIREFIKNRDSKFGDALKALADQLSRVAIKGVDIPQFLAGVEEGEGISSTHAVLVEAYQKYKNSVNKLVNVITGWRGNDPITVVYQQLFGGGVIVECSEAKEAVEKSWEERVRRKVPPGYKDSSKPDAGIGDYLIWLTILQLGRQHKKNLIFVTSEEKADWFVRSGREGIYARPELVDEYRRASNGAKFEIAGLSDILSDFETPEDIVKDVRGAEDEVSAAALVSSAFEDTDAHGVVFDYSTNDGLISVKATNGANFKLKFSKASDRSIHFYRTETVPLIARGKRLSAGSPISFEGLDSSSRSYTIQLGEVFLGKHSDGQVLVGRVIGLKDDTRGADSDEITFVYKIFGPGVTVFAP